MNEQGPQGSAHQGDTIRVFQKTDIVHGDSVETATHDREKEKTERYFICASCANIIASPEDAIAVDGRASHTFTNPSGITFRIACFSEAPGCSTVGEPTPEFTWFPGFMWSYAMCSRCKAHMGWYYQSGVSSFYGLILDNLREN